MVLERERYFPEELSCEEPTSEFIEKKRPQKRELYVLVRKGFSQEG